MSKNRYTTKCVKGKKIREHRLIMEDHLGRKLESYEHVYHKNGDSKDNDLSNLIVITKNVYS